MNHRKRFSLLVVRGDGVRVLRFDFPRRWPIAAALTLVMVAGATMVLAANWWHLRHRVDDAGPLLQEIADQRATLDAVNRRLANIRGQMASWGELHERIWEPFGPDIARRVRGAGIGGGQIMPPDPTRRPSPSDEIEQLAASVSEETEDLRALDELIGRVRKALVALPSRWPVRGPVNSEFGVRLSPWTKSTEFHGGMDIAADRGTPVLAPAPGVVDLAGPDQQFGLAVVIDHGEDIKTLYGHLSRIDVKSGQHVERGSMIGRTGNTGRSTGPHLHYEILVQGHPVNPRAYLWD